MVLGPINSDKEHSSPPVLGFSSPRRRWRANGLVLAARHPSSLLRQPHRLVGARSRFRAHGPAKPSAHRPAARRQHLLFRRSRPLPLATVLNLLVDQSAGKIAIQVATANILIESIPIPEVDQLGNATESASQGMSVASYTNEVNAIREGIVLETKDGCNIGGPARTMVAGSIVAAASAGPGLLSYCLEIAAG